MLSKRTVALCLLGLCFTVSVDGHFRLESLTAEKEYAFSVEVPPPAGSAANAVAWYSDDDANSRAPVNPFSSTDGGGGAAADFVCGRHYKPGAAAARVAAGDAVTLRWSSIAADHRGPIIDYLARCPDNRPCHATLGSAASTLDATQLRWVKIAELGLVTPAGANATSTGVNSTISGPHNNQGGGGVNVNHPPSTGLWATDLLLRTNLTGLRHDAGEKKEASTTHVAWKVTIPVSVPPGYYVLREEIIALMGKADANQHYPRCVNLEIVAAGSSGNVTAAAAPWDDAGMANGALPASQLYSATDPSLAVGPWQGVQQYFVPGPPCWKPSHNGIVSTTTTPSTTPLAAYGTTQLSNTLMTSSTAGSSPTSTPSMFTSITRTDLSGYASAASSSLDQSSSSPSPSTSVQDAQGQTPSSAATTDEPTTTIRRTIKLTTTRTTTAATLTIDDTSSSASPTPSSSVAPGGERYSEREAEGERVTRSISSVGSSSSTTTSTPSTSLPSMFAALTRTDLTTPAAQPSTSTVTETMTPSLSAYSSATGQLTMETPASSQTCPAPVTVTVTPTVTLTPTVTVTVVPETMLSTTAAMATSLAAVNATVSAGNATAAAPANNAQPGEHSGAGNGSAGEREPNRAGGETIVLYNFVRLTHTDSNAGGGDSDDDKRGKRLAYPYKRTNRLSHIRSN